MKNDEDIRRDTVAELEAMQARGESRTDMSRVLAKTEEELERDIAADPDWRDVPRDWYKAAEAVMPVPEKLLPPAAHPAATRPASRSRRNEP